jgi:uncharacterized membrane protein YhaH (DUF805 family)
MPLRRYAEFSGRSRRKEYWMYVLGLCAVSVVLSAIEGAAGINKMVLGVYGPATALLLVGTFIPSLAVAIRRLHDTGRSGWWIAPLFLLEAAMLYFIARGDLTRMVPGDLVIFAILACVTLVVALILLIFMLLDGTKGPNKYGPDPKSTDTDKVFA